MSAIGLGTAEGFVYLKTFFIAKVVFVCIESKDKCV